MVGGHPLYEVVALRRGSGRENHELRHVNEAGHESSKEQPVHLDSYPPHPPVASRSPLRATALIDDTRAPVGAR